MSSINFSTKKLQVFINNGTMVIRGPNSAAKLPIFENAYSNICRLLGLIWDYRFPYPSDRMELSRQLINYFNGNDEVDCILKPLIDNRSTIISVTLPDDPSQAFTLICQNNTLLSFKSIIYPHDGSKPICIDGKGAFDFIEFTHNELTAYYKDRLWYERAPLGNHVGNMYVKEYDKAIDMMLMEYYQISAL